MAAQLTEEQGEIVPVLVTAWVHSTPVLDHPIWISPHSTELPTFHLRVAMNHEQKFNDASSTAPPYSVCTEMEAA